MTRTPLPTLLALLLTACGASDADYNAVHVDTREARAQARIDAAANTVGPREVALKGMPLATPTPNAARDRAFPTAYEGFWGVTPNDCELANVEAHGRINIDNDTVRLFDDEAQVERLAVRSPLAVDSVLRFSGDPGRPERTTRFVLEAGGTRLVRVEQQPGGATPVTTRYQRC